MPSQPLGIRQTRFILWLTLGPLSVAGVIAQGQPKVAPAPAQNPEPPPLRRIIPEPLADHPGNVYLADEEVYVRWPQELPKATGRWQALDMNGVKVQTGELTAAAIASGPELNLGWLEVGYYRIEFLDQDGRTVTWTSAAVLGRLGAPVPLDSPVCLDVAAAWFAKDDPEGQRRLANLAALAGANWVRDRLRWREIQPGPETFARQTTYDASAKIQHEAGLKVLQVFHDTPAWAREGERSGEFTDDLRVLYRFCRSMARRFKGLVQAWEPWNEANAPTFGGHTIDAMCSWQKAAWLGFKAGDPELIVGWNPTAGVPTTQQTTGLLANETWPYYDSYNIHTYDWPHAFLDLWEPARAAACGRPLWITESDRGIKHQNDPPWYDLTPRDERLKAEWMAPAYAQSLFAGAVRHFHFILGHYCEPNGVQFGLLRRDLTPRPAYVALAAVGRFLAGARCLGRWLPGENAHVYAFRAKPDGREQDVLVAWAEKEVDWPARGVTQATWTSPEDLVCEQVYDFLGKSQGSSVPQRLTSAPQFFILPTGEADKLPLATPPVSPGRSGTVSPVVLQVQMPPGSRVKVEDKPWSEGQAYRFELGEERSFSLVAYNFGEQAVAGQITVAQLPSGWQLCPQQWEVTLPPMGRQSWPVTFLARKNEATEAAEDGWVQLEGIFGTEGRSVVAFRCVHR